MSWASLLDVLFPPTCVSCDAPGSALCPRCRPAASVAPRFVIGVLPCVALGPYEGPLRRAVLAMKSGRRDVAGTLGTMLATLAREAPQMSGVVALVPVPTTRRRRAQRGFDQATLLARSVGEACNVGVIPALRQVAGGPQHGRSRADRLAAAGRFRCDAASLVPGARVLLVDDVATTGATLRDCGATLTHAGVKVAGALLAARALEGRASSNT